MRAEYNVRATYVGDGLTNAYTFDFKIVDKSHLLVLHLDSQAEIVWQVRATDTSHFTTTLGTEGGSITLVSNLPDDHELIIVLADDEPTQPSNYATNDKFTTKKIENSLDTLSGQVQRIRYLLDRSFKFPERIINTDVLLESILNNSVLALEYDAGSDKWFLKAVLVSELIGAPAPSVFALESNTAKEISFDTIAGEDLSALKFVYLDTAGKAFRGGYDTSVKSNVIGITKTAALLGATVKILAFGRIDDSSFAYNPGEILYLTTLGGISITSPINPPANYRKPVAQGLQTGSIFVNIREAITLTL